jgi:hypothetical protein
VSLGAAQPRRPDAATGEGEETSTGTASAPASLRTAIESIEAATVDAHAGGHILAGFVRRCNSAGYGFYARCRVCRIEVGVHRSASGWGRTPHLPDCTPGPGPGRARIPTRNGP